MKNKIKRREGNERKEWKNQCVSILFVLSQKSTTAIQDEFTSFHLFTIIIVIIIFFCLLLFFSTGSITSHSTHEMTLFFRAFTAFIYFIYKYTITII